MLRKKSKFEHLQFHDSWWILCHIIKNLRIATKWSLRLNYCVNFVFRNQDRTLMLNLSNIDIHWWLLKLFVHLSLIRKKVSSARCVGSHLSAPPLSPHTCSSTRTPGLTPASSAARGSTRSLIWRNTRTFTPVCRLFYIGWPFFFLWY